LFSLPLKSHWFLWQNIHKHNILCIHIILNKQIWNNECM
jgi:hypothetical protein